MLTESLVSDIVSPRFLSTEHIHLQCSEAQPQPGSGPRTEKQKDAYLFFRSQIKFTVLKGICTHELCEPDTKQLRENKYTAMCCQVLESLS